MGYFAGLFKRGSKKIPFPCISRLATNEFQYLMLPHPVYVTRFIPFRPNAAGIRLAATLPSGRNAFPSINKTAANFPGPQSPRTFRKVGSSTCNISAIGFALSVNEIMPPTLRSLFGHPSSRLPIPGAKESSTVEWQTAQVIPIDCKAPLAPKFPFTPTTEFNFNNAIVVLGSSRLIAPDFTPDVI